MEFVGSRDIVQQTGDREWSHASWYGCDIAEFFESGEVSISDDTFDTVSIYPDIDDGRSWLHHVCGDEIFLSDCTDDDICILGRYGDIRRLTMAPGHGRSCMHEHETHRSPYDRRSPDHGRVLASYIYIIVLE